jgi:hypothetical protein
MSYIKRFLPDSLQSRSVETNFPFTRKTQLVVQPESGFNTQFSSILSPSNISNDFFCILCIL